MCVVACIDRERATARTLKETLPGRRVTTLSVVKHNLTIDTMAKQNYVNTKRCMEK